MDTDIERGRGFAKGYKVNLRGIMRLGKPLRAPALLGMVYFGEANGGDESVIPPHPDDCWEALDGSLNATGLYQYMGLDQDITGCDKPRT
jgi:hypothetical protein